MSGGERRKLFIQADSGSGALQYYLTIDPLYDSNEDKPCLENYGVMVVYNGDGRAEERSIRRITPRYDKIERLISILCDNHVTPDSLQYIVEDWLLA